MMYLKEITVPIPFDKGRVIIRNEKLVLYEIQRTYPSDKKNSRVERRTIGKIDPFFPGRMYPNEAYFELVPNEVPEEIRDGFLRKCEHQRQIAELKKDPEAMMRQVARGLSILKEKGREIAEDDRRKRRSAQDQGKAQGTEEAENMIETNGNDRSEEKVWFISDYQDLEYLMKVFRDLYDMMEGYAAKNPGGIVDEYKVKMFNRILAELKNTLPDHQIIQGLEILQEPEWQEDEEGNRFLDGQTNSDAVMLLAWYKNGLGTS